jgi:hypothetical protein
MILDPRKSFNESPARPFFHDASATSWFARAVEVALLEMQASLNKPGDMATAAAYHFRMEGARQFVGILMNLTETAPQKKEPIAQNLPGNIRK